MEFSSVIFPETASQEHLFFLSTLQRDCITSGSLALVVGFECKKKRNKEKDLGHKGEKMKKIHFKNLKTEKKTTQVLRDRKSL